MNAPLHDWLSLVEVSGPFLAVPVLKQVFPQGLDALPSRVGSRLRNAYDEWRDAVDAEDPELPALHLAWLDEVLRTALEIDEDALRRGAAIPASARPEGAPWDLVLVDTAHDDRLLLPIQVLAPDAPVDRPTKRGAGEGAAERMAASLRALGHPLGLVTNGEVWMLVHAPVGGVATYASWYARLWSQERDTLRAFVSLLGLRRFFGPEDERLPKLFERSLEHQDEVTDALGQQVRRAVEVLIQALDRADQDRGRELLRGVSERELYEAGLTVMMRLVFLLAAEERGLLLLGDPRYDDAYALSTLRLQLRTQPDEILERRRSAWSRLLALFRAVYGGIEHPTLRLPAMGGSLFDPDRFPFLEGRPKGSSWREAPAEPLPIDDRTVLLLLEAIQLFQGRTLSYRGLDVEQIGHVYEGLLERTVVRVRDVTLELGHGQQAQDPRVTLGELESAALDGRTAIVELLAERTKRSKPSLRKAMDQPVDERISARLLIVCRGDRALRDRVLPYASLLAVDPWGYPLVHPEGAFVVVFGTDRRSTGTHYTPKALTERIVEETLTPLVYDGPAEGKTRADWRLHDAEQLLELAVCDPAMGSGAFLVQTCRWLGKRLVEAWNADETRGMVIDAEGRAREPGEAEDPLPTDPEDRLLHAQRLIAERCIYGVDVNPMAVELAKLSLWLVTMAKGRPFGFLDHNLRSGDSLLGIHDLDQLVFLTMKPGKDSQLRLFGRKIREAVTDAVALRKQLRAIPIRDIRDVETMAHLDARARRRLEAPSQVADAMMGALLTTQPKKLDDALAGLATEVARYLDEGADGSDDAGRRLRHRAKNELATDLPKGKPARRPFHWPLEFPEVFQRANAGFDGFVGNPPFLGGQRLTGTFGTAYRDYLVRWLADGKKGSADLVSYFFLRVFTLLRPNGHFGLLAVNTIAEGDTRQVGLERLVGELGAAIHAAYPNEPWPGKAAVITSRVHVRKGEWNAEASLSGRAVPYVSAFLSDEDDWSPRKLVANAGKSFQGSIVLGMGFVLSEEEAMAMIERDPKNRDVLFPYLNGKDLNTHPEQKPSRWVINFWDWPEERAMEYEEPYRRVLELVKPERDKNKRTVYRKYWWQYGEKRPALYHAIGRGHAFEKHPKGWDPEMEPMERVLAIVTSATKYPSFALVSSDTVFANTVCVLADADLSTLTVVTSNIHMAWAWSNGSRLKSDLRYTNGDIIDTFPFPALDTAQEERLSVLSANLVSLRKKLMFDRKIGLRELFKTLNSHTESAVEVHNIRELFTQIDEAVAQAYGWDDLDLEHGFHEVDYLPENDRLRFTISESARREVLRRLARLNKERYEEEVRQGLHDKKRAKGTTRRRKAGSQGAPLPFPRPKPQSYPLHQPEVLIAADRKAIYGGSSARADRDSASQAILDFLNADPGWYAKGDILAATGVLSKSWTKAINGLLDEGLVERQGERRGARYRMASDSPSSGHGGM